MPERYFEKFANVTYSNTQVKDITQRVVISNNALTNTYAYYPYDLSHNERADQFAYRYYGDSYYSWLVYLSNGIVDPYYEWYMDQNEFRSYIEKKYGSVELAQTKIKFYRSDWFDKDNITVSYYNSLPTNLLRYWEPQFNLNGSISGYTRKKEDIIVNTNSIRAYTVANTDFKKDEICTVYFSPDYIGQGQVLYVANNKLYLQHTSGVTLSNSTVLISGASLTTSGSSKVDYGSVTESTNAYFDYGDILIPPTQVIDLGATIVSYIYGHESGINTSFSSTISYANNFAIDEEVYYTPVTYYEYENERNEYYKTINVLDNVYAKSIAVNLKGLLK